MIHLLIIAPTQVLRAGLRSLLSADEEIAITGEATNLTDIGGTPPDTDVILDAATVLVESASRADFTEWIRLHESHPALLLLSDDLPSRTDFYDLPVRAWGILPLDVSGEELIAAVHAVSEGLIVGSPHLLGTLITQTPARVQPITTGTPVESKEMSEFLTTREAEVLQLVAQGLANKQIALSLGISEHTVKFHVSSIYAKLGVVNRTEAVRAGVRQGLILL